MPRVYHRGKAYHLGDLIPCPLPAFLPEVLPAGWEALDTSPWTGTPDPDYARAYAALHQKS
jgi:hypothetical protein